MRVFCLHYRGVGFHHEGALLGCMGISATQSALIWARATRDSRLQCDGVKTAPIDVRTYARKLASTLPKMRVIKPISGTRVTVINM